jgi:hypothetical protein
VKKNNDGSRMYMYKHRHMNVLVNSSGAVLSVGIFSGS